MNSLGKSSKWPSYDSLPSTPSFLLSESEQTEDEADIFSSEGEGESGVSKPFSDAEATTHSGKYFAFSGHSDPSYCGSEKDQAELCPDKPKHRTSAPSPRAATLGSSSATPGDLAFAQKCADLRRFIRPLLELLNGLKTGRFDKGLNSFQQSVATDRLQRIVGILQKPDMGEKYLRTLLQVEMMLKVWFPQVAFQSSDTLTQSTASSLPTRWHQNQLHIPVKKRKLSWSDTDPAGTVPPQYKHHQQGDLRSCQAPQDTVSTCLPGAAKKQKGPEEVKDEPDKGNWASGHELTHSTGTLSRPSKSCGKEENEKWERLEYSPPSAVLLSPGGSPATQDGSVSSSSAVATADSP
ncbi:circadian associated repressor of transcription a [Myripristis murdjan]|uniref:circadian associated repressor of transcription a n=1 Tax=Myripristis murdjan TaxID=586833 RepID=UPI001176126B|nr:circadian-associated transcriptional repressor-like [Myripristis murdjan]